jgi:hypothetical protein
LPSLAEEIALQPRSGYVVAPAGYGKTHLIADAVSRSTNRQLILTHTYAGVNALRVKLRTLRVSTRLFRLDTIASWTLRLVLAFRNTSGWTSERPSGEEWAALYGAAASLLEHEFIVRMLRASYGGVFVDEYQDCSTVQHELVRQLATSLRVRIVGDPMQGIFDFDGEPVDWARDVASKFDSFGELDTPHRWIRSGAPELGDWLHEVRRSLELGQTISLVSGLPRQVKVEFATSPEDLARKQGSVCRYFRCQTGDEAVAVFGGGPQAKGQSHRLARQAGGAFSSIEEIEGKTLFATIRRIEAARTSQDRLKAMLKFAEECMTAVKENLSAATRRAEIAEVRHNTRNPEIATAANVYLADPSSANASRILALIKAAEGVVVARTDLLNRMVAVLRKQAVNPSLSLVDAAEKYQAEFRRSGRLAGRRVIGTTLLVKGLQFDHAIVLNAASLSTKELYVALTRGAKSLRILSTTRTLAAPQ